MNHPEPRADAAAIERMLRASLETYAATAQRLQPSGPVRMLRVGGAVALDNGPGSHRSRVVGLALERPATAADLDVIDGFFAETGNGYTVEAAPCTEGGTAALLAARGFSEGPPIGVLTRPVAPGDAGSTAWAGGRIAAASPEDALGVAAVFAEGFGGYPTPTAEDVLAARVAAAAPSTTMFIAVMEGQAVACGAVQIHGTVALLFAACTVPRARRAGAHRALIGARLACAAEAGCTLAVVQAAAGAPSLENLVRAGFAPAYERRPFKRAGR